MDNQLKDLFNKHYSPLCNYAATIIHDQHAAEDVVQSVFIQLWENKKIFELDKPERYLIKCVRFKCYDLLKSKHRKHEVFMKDLPEMSIEQITNLSEEDIAPLLNYFVSKLPPKMQQVFLMSRQQGMTYKEISEELNVSPKTIENQMGTALKKLRSFLREHQYLPFFLFLLS